MIATAGFAEYPRGRIEFDSGRRAFAIYADHRLLAPAFIEYVLAVFAIPGEHCTVEVDAKYTSSLPLGPPKHWY